MKSSRFRHYFYLGLTFFTVLALAIVFWFILNRFGTIRALADKIITILTPITYGAVMAFLVSPVYNKCTFRLKKQLMKLRLGEERAYKWAKFVATFACLLLIVLIVASLIMMILPQLFKNIADMLKDLPSDVDRWSNNVYLFMQSEELTRFFETYPELRLYIENYINHNLADMDIKITTLVTESLLPNLQVYISNLSSGFINFIRQFFNIIIGLIVMTYLLNIKLTLSAQVKKLLYSILPIEHANVIVEECRYIKTVFSQFILGKIIDSLIIGLINYAFMLLVGMEYALLISVVVGVTNVIPFFGPFIGAIPSIVILLLVSPMQSLQFAVWILFLQQVDGNIIGPKILGQTTGLPSFWILFSILLFGGLFGIVGMIIGVPTFAIIYRMLARQSVRALSKKGLSVESRDYMLLRHIDKESGEYIKLSEEAQ